MRISDWSSDVCSSDLETGDGRCERGTGAKPIPEHQAGGRMAEPVRTHAREDARSRPWPALSQAWRRRALPYRRPRKLVGRTREDEDIALTQIGRATCRERVCLYV